MDLGHPVDDNLPKIINQVFTYGEHTYRIFIEVTMVSFFPHLVKKRGKRNRRERFEDGTWMTQASVLRWCGEKF